MNQQDLTNMSTNDTAAVDFDLERLIEAARRHGEDSEPDHEVGDLQDILRAAWEQLTPDQRRRVIRSPEVSNVVEAAGGDLPLLQTVGDLADVDDGELAEALQFVGAPGGLTAEQEVDAVNALRLNAFADDEERDRWREQAAPGRG